LPLIAARGRPGGGLQVQGPELIHAEDHLRLAGLGITFKEFTAGFRDKGEL
jgi:hypothetical protein